MANEWFRDAKWYVMYKMDRFLKLNLNIFQWLNRRITIGY